MSQRQPHTDAKVRPPRRALRDAQERLAALASGYDPETGIRLPRDHVCQQPDTLRALFRGVDALARQLTSPNTKRSPVTPQVARAAVRPERADVDWSLAEDRRLVAAARAGASPRALARKHARTLVETRARLRMLGL